MDIAAKWDNAFARWMWSMRIVDKLSKATSFSSDGGDSESGNGTAKTIHAVGFDVLRDSGYYPNAWDLMQYSLTSVLAITISRSILEMFVLAPIAKSFLKLKHFSLPMESNELEQVYENHKPTLPDINDVKALSNKLGYKVEAINTWFKNRQAKDRNEIKVKRCSESLWRLMVYSICLGGELCLVWDQPWFRNTKLCWEDPDEQLIPQSLRVFYVGVQLPLYLHLLFAQTIDRRKAGDHWEMLTHHALVVALMSLSYLGNFIRIGCLALLYHDITDVFLETSKLGKYLRWSSLGDLAFAGLCFTWGYARIYKFPLVVLRSIILESGEADVIGPSYYAFLLLLAMLYALNLYWFRAIASMAYRIYWAGAEKHRAREQTDLSTDDDIDSDSSYFSDHNDPPLHAHED